MATATILSVYQDKAATYAAVWVNEGGKRVEYIGSVPRRRDLADYGFPGQQWDDLGLPEKKQALTAAVKAERDSRLDAPAPVAGITGTVTV